MRKQVEMDKIRSVARQPDYLQPDDEFITITFEQLLAAARRQLRVVLVLAVLGLLVGIGYIAFATPSYESTARLLIDPTRVAGSDPSTPVMPAQDTAPWVASQIELVKSLKVATLAVSHLDINGQDRKLIPPQDTFMNRVTGAISGLIHQGATAPAVDPATARHDAAVQFIVDNLQVIQQPDTYVIDISIETPDPALSARVANAVMQAYIDGQFIASKDDSERTTQWVAQQVNDLAKQVADATAAADAFRQQNNLVQADGHLLPDQQLTAASTKQSLDQAKLSQDSALLDQGKSILQGGQVSAMLADLTTNEGNNPDVAALASHYSDASVQEQRVTASFGADHPQAVALRAEVADAEKAVAAKYADIVAARQHAVDIDQQAVKGDADQIAQLSGRVGQDNAKLQQLQSLESTAQTYRDLQQSFLTRLQQAQQQGSFPVSQARVVEDATPSLQPSSPKKLYVLVLSLLGGCIVGAGVGFLREVNDRSFRTGKSVTERLGIGFIGYFPSMNDRQPLSPPAIGKDRLSYVSLYPYSLAANTIRNARVTINMLSPAGESGTVVAVVSAREGEGKTTVAANLAISFGRSGARVLLVDLDVVHTTLTDTLGVHVKTPLGGVVRGEVAIADAVAHSEGTGVDFLGASDTDAPNTDILASGRMHEFLTRARQTYDYVILDTPPLIAVAETRVLLRMTDIAICAIAWGSTDHRAVKSALQPAIGTGVLIAGAVLTQGRIAAIKRYESGDWSPDEYGYMLSAERRPSATAAAGTPPVRTHA